MKIIQQLTTDDIISLNKFVSNKNTKEKLMLFLIPALSALSAFLCFTKNYIVIGILFIVLGIFFFIGLTLLKKKTLLKKSKENAKAVEGKEIIADISEEGLMYYFSTEDISNYSPFIWGDFYQVTRINDVFFFEIDTFRILLVKPNNDEELTFIKKICEKELILGIRYFEK